MSKSFTKNNQPLWAKARPRERTSALDGRVTDHLLRSSTRLDQAQDAKQIAEVLGVPYSTATAALRRLAGSGRLVPRYIVNNFRTRYCHEYLVALAIDGRAVAASHKKRRERFGKRGDDEGLRDGGPDELFIEEVVADLASHAAYRAHLIVHDVVILHGDPARDIELYILTDDGAYTLGCWIRNELTSHPCVRAIHTVMVGFRYSRNGYSGQNLNRHDASGGAVPTDAGS